MKKPFWNQEPIKNWEIEIQRVFPGAFIKPSSWKPSTGSSPSDTMTTAHPKPILKPRLAAAMAVYIQAAKPDPALTVNSQLQNEVPPRHY